MFDELQVTPSLMHARLPGEATFVRVVTQIYDDSRPPYGRDAAVDQLRHKIVEQSVAAGAGVDIHQQFVKRVLNLQDQDIREALIKLGWTPPPGE